MRSGDTKIIMINIWAFLFKFAVVFIIVVGLVFILFGNRAKAETILEEMDFEDCTPYNYLYTCGWVNVGANNYRATTTTPAINTTHLDSISTPGNVAGRYDFNTSASSTAGKISFDFSYPCINFAESGIIVLSTFNVLTGYNNATQVMDIKHTAGINNRVDLRFYGSGLSWVDYNDIATCGVKHSLVIWWDSFYNLSRFSLDGGAFFDTGLGLVQQKTPRLFYISKSFTAGRQVFQLDNLLYIGMTAGEDYIDPVINENYDFDLLDWRSDINTVVNQNCMVGDTCKLWFSYNLQAIGNKVYLIPDVPFKQNPAYNVSSTTIVYTSDWQNSVLVPPQASATSSLFCLYMVDDTDGDLVTCGINISWLNPSIYDDYLAEFADYDITTACNDVSTSTGAFWDDFRFGIECGIRKIIYWSFKPSKNSVVIFSKNIGSIQNKFPLNTYFSLLNDVNSAISSTTLNNAGSLGIPFVNADDVNNPEFVILPVLASTSIPNAIGETNSKFFRMTIGWILWLFAVGFILITVRAKH